MINFRYIIICIIAVFASCTKEIGFLETQNAEYYPNQMDIRLVLDEELDAYRIYNVAPWVSPQIQGVLGTNPMTYEIEKVKSKNGNAEMFKALLSIRGGGRMVFPLVSDITPGDYIISIRVKNEGYNHILEDIFTFTVK